MFMELHVFINLIPLNKIIQTILFPSSYFFFMRLIFKGNGVIFRKTHYHLIKLDH